MWATLWGLWYRNQEVKIIKEMDFAWSGDSVSKLDTMGIFHNAGIVSEMQGDTPVFYKGKYHQGLNPLEDEYVDSLLNNEKNKLLCNNFYVQAIHNLKLKYGTKY